MKKYFLLIAVSFAASISFAQTKASFGAKAGIINSSMTGEAVNNFKDLLDFADGHISTSNRTGFYAGVNGNIPLGGTISVEPGIYYSQKGYTLKGDLNLKGLEFLGANASAKLQSQYLDMPVLLKANLGSGFNVFAGPQFSYLVQSDLRTQAGVLGFNLLDKTLDATDQFNRWDAAVTGGLGYTFKNGMNISASYDHGLSKLDKNQNMNAYSRGIRVGIGINF
jgi:hypothetical protein